MLCHGQGSFLLSRALGRQKAEYGKELMKSGKALEFADAVTTMLQDAAHRKCFGHQAWICKEQGYDWSAVLQEPDELLPDEEAII